MVRVLVTLALLVALAATGQRWHKRRRLRRLLLQLPGASADNATAVASFDAIAEHVHQRRCPCGGRYDAFGEGSQTTDGRRLRVVQLECRFCERQTRMYFDVTTVFH